MTSRAIIDTFMGQKKLALIRASRKTRISGFSIGKELKARGYSVSIVYLDEDSSGAKLKDLKESVGGVIIAVPANQTEKAVRQAIDAGIPRVWMQRGTESKPAIQLCEKKGTSVIHGECVMMFAEPVKLPHSFHRGVLKLIGKLPK